MEVFTVKSKGLSEVGYDFDNNILMIKFSDGNLYHYKEVQSHIYINLLKSDCKLTYFNSIKNDYTYKKIK